MTPAGTTRPARPEAADAAFGMVRHLLEGPGDDGSIYALRLHLPWRSTCMDNLLSAPTPA